MAPVASVSSLANASNADDNSNGSSLLVWSFVFAAFDGVSYMLSAFIDNMEEANGKMDAVRDDVGNRLGIS